MTPRSVYEQYADQIVDTGDCWNWTGEIPADRRKVPMIRIGGSYGTAVGHGLRAIGQSTVKGEVLVMSCENDMCVHPEHACAANSEVGRMLYIKNHVEFVGDCQIWKGAVSNGVPRMPRRTYHPGRGASQDMAYVRRFVWCVEHIPAGVKWPTNGGYKAKCGDSMCVSPRHLIRSARGGNDEW